MRPLAAPHAVASRIGFHWIGLILLFIAAPHPFTFTHLIHPHNLGTRKWEVGSEQNKWVGSFCRSGAPPKPFPLFLVQFIHTTSTEHALSIVLPTFCFSSFFFLCCCFLFSSY